MRAVVYTAEIDDRFGAGKVSSRIGLSSPAKLFNQNSSLFEEIRAENAQQRIHCVLVDESQFLTRQQVYELSEVVDQLDIPVLCYGLRTDFRGELFGGSEYLLAWSDKLVELKPFVSVAVRPAWYYALIRLEDLITRASRWLSAGMNAMCRYVVNTTNKRSLRAL